MNKYERYYNILIDSRKTRLLDKSIYTEKHHIIPKSLGGPNSRDNLLRLLPREHFIAHLLLAKMFTGEAAMKMSFALNRMMTGHNGKRYVPNSRIYNITRTLIMQNCSGDNCPSTGRTGEKHFSFGRKAEIYNDEFRAKISVTSKCRIPANKGISGVVKMSAETCAKMSASGKGRPKSSEHSKKIGDAQRGIRRGPQSDIVKAKRAIAMREYWAKKKADNGNH